MEEILETMRKLQYEQTSESVKVVDVRYLGKINLNNVEKDIYLIIKQEQVVEQGKVVIREIESYVTEDLEEIAGNNRNDAYNFLLVTEKYMDEKSSIEEQLNELYDEISLNEMENERAREIADVLGVTLEQLVEIDEVDLQQEVGEDKGKKQEELTENELDGLQIKEETNLSQNIKGETLENKLGLKKHGIEDGVKVARVTSSSLNHYIDEANTQVDAFVVIRRNGKAVVLGDDILEVDNRLGTNPSKSGTTINNDGTVREEGITSSYRIKNGNGNEYLRVSHDEASGKEIKYGMYSPQEGKYVDIELETQRTMIQDNDVRQFMKDKGAGNREAQDIIKRNEQHGECEEKDVTVIDNDKTNDSHIHENNQTSNLDEYIPNTNMTWKKFASICGYRGTDRIEMAQKKWKTERDNPQNLSKDNEQLLENIEEKINGQYR